MTKSTLYIPAVVLRQNRTGSFRMRLSLGLNPDESKQRVQLGLNTKDLAEAEEIAIAACKIFMIFGLCDTSRCLKFRHDGQKNYFHEIFPNEEFLMHCQSPEFGMIPAMFGTEREPDPSPPVVKNYTYRYLLSLISASSFHETLRLVELNTARRDEVEARKRIKRVLDVLRKVCCSGHSIKLIHFPGLDMNSLKPKDPVVVSFRK